MFLRRQNGAVVTLIRCQSPETWYYELPLPVLRFSCQLLAPLSLPGPRPILDLLLLQSFFLCGLDAPPPLVGVTVATGSVGLATAKSTLELFLAVPTPLVVQD